MKTVVPQDSTERLKRLRLKYSLTQTRLAQLLGITATTVQRWEEAQSKPSVKNWEKLSLIENYGLNALSPDSLNEVESFGVSESLVPYRQDIEQVPHIDFSTNPEIVKLVSESERLCYGQLVNPSFATEISLIEPLPHQRIAVYEYMLPQSRLRFLLADDAGAGKTIMTGLYIREMLARRLIRRILIVPPAGLVGNWESELRTLFKLPFRVVAGSEARNSNPFTESGSNCLIVSVDTLAGERMFSRLMESSVVPYDLVVFDEAHKLSARRDPDLRIRKTVRYHLAEALAGVTDKDTGWNLGWSCRHVLLLTATPHMGRDYPYFALWRLLEPHMLSTPEAFKAYPVEARRDHFIRRAKEEMVRFNGAPIYPMRITDTLSFDLTQGEISEQTLYNETTEYIQIYYNKAKLLNRSAARLVMSVFQRRLASSTYALLISMQRRLDKLDGLIDDLRSGRLSEEQFHRLQLRLDVLQDDLDQTTADEEESEDGQETHEKTEDKLLQGVIATSLAELEIERIQVEKIYKIAKQVFEKGEETKFERLRGIFEDPQYENEKLIVFTEHRDTLTFLLRRLEGLGFTGRVAKIHGGMPYKEREVQVEFFRKPNSEGGANILLATDAAGEGINLQFCWLMVNYDVPWNPARLEQRMGRIHRYGQTHDPVVILNLVAGKTREGRVIKTLLEKLEKIRKELGSDKVFDVVGRLFEGVSIRDYIEQATFADDEEIAIQQIEGTLTEKQVKAIEEREKLLYGTGGDVRQELPRLIEGMDQESLRRLLPGYVRRFMEKVVPLMDLKIVGGDLDSQFTLQPLKQGAFSPFLSAFDQYPTGEPLRLTVYKPERGDQAIWLHPGEPFFDQFRDAVCAKFGEHALRGGVFVDPTAERPYMFHLAFIKVLRAAEPDLKPLAREELLEYRLVGLKQEENKGVRECPVEHLLLLRGGKGIPLKVAPFAATADTSRETARAFAVENLAWSLTETHREKLLEDLPEREAFIKDGFAYESAELAATRTRMTERLRNGDIKVTSELTRIKNRQREISRRRDEELTCLHREPELIIPGDVVFLSHALVIPSDDPEDKQRYSKEVEEIAVRVAWTHEEALGADVKDVSRPELARTAGLEDWPGFDLVSRRPDGEELAIEVKGRAQIGDVELKENEWSKACTLGDRYWLYVVYDCASSNPRLLKVQNPFKKLLVKAKGGVIIDEKEIFGTAED